jgi:hypothetical protein
MVAVFSMTEEVVTAALKSPLTMIASDGILENGKGHPRTAGTYSRCTRQLRAPAGRAEFDRCVNKNDFDARATS